MRVLFFLSLISCQDISAGDDSSYLEKGKILDTVRCKISPNYSYALYVPSDYSDTLKWPVIYIFDPAARGRLAVTVFLQAAEKYGYVLISSNNSRNGQLGEELTEVLNTLFADVESRFSIDPDRIYTSGFSGGSRVAARIALNNKNISGVIACGAGFPANFNGINSLSFDYIGLVGTRDMNYLEMIELEKKLDSLGINVELRIFEGDHDWPSPDILQAAVEWLELQALKKGIIEKDKTFINEQFEKYESQAAQLLKQGNLTESIRIYTSVIEAFPTLSEEQKIPEKLDSILQSNEYRKLIRKLNKDRSWELEKQHALMTAFNQLLQAETMPDSVLYWWVSQIKLLKKYETGHDANRQVIATRQLNLLLYVCYESGSNLMNINRFKAASCCYQLESLLTPENKYTYYRLARAYAFDHETKHSLNALKKAISLGYDNKLSIMTDKAFIPLRTEKKYNEILRQL